MHGRYRLLVMVALKEAKMVSTESDLGPSVPTILVMAGKKALLICSHDSIEPSSNVTNESNKLLRGLGLTYDSLSLAAAVIR
jgi:hypothetical protein